MNAISYVVYIILQLLCIPLAIVGIAITGYKQIKVSAKLGVSQTAIEILNGRWTMDIFGMRSDPATVALAKALPNTSTNGLWVTLFPLWVKYKISGKWAIYPTLPPEGQEKIMNLVPSRTMYFDGILQRELVDAEQFVMMGAGYDTRAFREDIRDKSVKIFELDQTTTQRQKLGILESLGFNVGDVSFLEVDFRTDDIFEILKGAGYDPNKKTVFLWEGVTLYLTETEVTATMTQVLENASKGSILVADFYGTRMLRIGQTGPTKKTLDETNEDMVFGFDFSSNWVQTLETFATDRGYAPGETHFMGSDDKNGPFVAVTELIIK